MRLDDLLIVGGGQGAGGVQEAGEGRAESGRSKRAESGREM